MARVYQKRDGTEIFDVEGYEGPESRAPHKTYIKDGKEVAGESKIFKATSRTTKESVLLTNQELHLWYQVVPPAAAPSK